MIISYDGKRYHGWQIQKNAVTVQEVYQKALKKVLGYLPDIKGCSRTDSKAHANTYCINFHLQSLIPCDKFVIAVNKHLPKDIAALKCIDVGTNFHARYSCKGKEYVYKIWNHQIRNPFLDGYAMHHWYHLDEYELNVMAQDYVGKKDFTSFCTFDKRETGNMIRTIEYFKVCREQNLLIFKVKADGFLYNMVRIMVGTLIRNVRKKECSINTILSLKNRSCAGPTAPACGLYLNRVFYEGLIL
jgi:tRNA pseudouridine38-40 synthase